MRIYYLDNEYESGKHKIVKVWSKYVDRAMPEDSPKTAINVPYTVLEIDERYNRLLAKNILTNNRMLPNGVILSDKFYINNSGEIVNNDTDEVVTINPNPQRESYKLSQLYGMTQSELETYIENNVTNLAEAKAYIKKLSAVVLWLVKQSGLDEE